METHMSLYLSILCFLVHSWQQSGGLPNTPLPVPQGNIPSSNSMTEQCSCLLEEPPELCYSMLYILVLVTLDIHRVFSLLLKWGRWSGLHYAWLCMAFFELLVKNSTQVSPHCSGVAVHWHFIEAYLHMHLWNLYRMVYKCKNWWYNCLGISHMKPVLL